jgi:hypothetical protein
MEALKIEGQTDQAPLACGGQFPAQGELAEAQHLLDDADHRFDGAFACLIDRFAQRGLELVGHLDQGARVLGGRIGQRREPLLPARMMGIPARRNVGLDAAFRTGGQRRRAKIASIKCRCLRGADCRRHGAERGFGFLTVVGVIRERAGDDEQTPLIDGDLGIVILLKTRIRRIFHDARLRVGLGKDTARCVPFGVHVSASSPPNPACKLSLHRALHHPSPDGLPFLNFTLFW